MSLENFAKSNIDVGSEGRPLLPTRTATIRELQQANEGSADRCLLLPELLNQAKLELYWSVTSAHDPSKRINVPAVKTHVRQALTNGEPVYVAEADTDRGAFRLELARSKQNLKDCAPYARSEFFTLALKPYMSAVTVKRIRALASSIRPGYGSSQEFDQNYPSESDFIDYSNLQPLRSNPHLQLADDIDLEAGIPRENMVGADEFIPAMSRVIQNSLEGSIRYKTYFSLKDFCLAAVNDMMSRGHDGIYLNKSHYKAAKIMLTGAGYAVFKRKGMGAQGNLTPVFGSVNSQMAFIDELNTLPRNKRAEHYESYRLRFDGVDTNEDDGADE